MSTLQDADIAAGSLIVTDLRRQFVDFTEPFLSLRSSALIRKPLASPPSTPHHDRRRRRRSTTTTRPLPRLRRPARVRTAAELLASELSYGVVSGSAVQRGMSTSRDNLTRALWSRIATFRPPALVDSVQEGVERARREPYAFIVDSPIAAYFAGRRPCELYISEPFLHRMTYAFAVRRGALRAAFDRELRRARATGELQAMYLRWWRDECAAATAAHNDDNDEAHIPAMTRDVASKVGRLDLNDDTGTSRSSDGSYWSRTASRRFCVTAALLTLRMLFESVVTLST